MNRLGAGLLVFRVEAGMNGLIDENIGKSIQRDGP